MHFIYIFFNSASTFESAKPPYQDFAIFFPPPFLQVVKDRVCLRALEKIIYQLADSKEQAEVLSATALQPVDVNADGTCKYFIKKNNNTKM